MEILVLVKTPGSSEPVFGAVSVSELSGKKLVHTNYNAFQVPNFSIQIYAQTVMADSMSVR